MCLLLNSLYVTFLLPKNRQKFACKTSPKKIFLYTLEKLDKTCSALKDVIFGDPEVASHTSDDVQTVNTRSDLMAMEIARSNPIIPPYYNFAICKEIPKPPLPPQLPHQMSFKDMSRKDNVQNLGQPVLYIILHTH